MARSYSLYLVVEVASGNDLHDYIVPTLVFEVFEHLCDIRVV